MEESCIWVTPIFNQEHLTYNVVDVGLVNLTYTIPDKYAKENKASQNITSALSYLFDLAVVC